MNEAMKRVAPSAPARWLASNELIQGRTLDYGCGHGYDAREYCMMSYDPHFQPSMPGGSFDTILCSYVLNTIESNDERLSVLQSIQFLLRPSGIAYITVRNDKRALCGTTGKGYQCHIVLRLPVVRCCSGYVIYALCHEYIDKPIMKAWIYEN